MTDWETAWVVLVVVLVPPLLSPFLAVWVYPIQAGLYLPFCALLYLVSRKGRDSRERFTQGFCVAVFVAQIAGFVLYLAAHIE